MLHQRFSNFPGLTEVCEIYLRTKKFKRQQMKKQRLRLFKIDTLSVKNKLMFKLNGLVFIISVLSY